jgi:uncharacterized membrane protein
MATIALLLFYLLTPLFILYICHKSATLKKIGAVVWAYIIGLLIGNIGILPKASKTFHELLKGQSFLPKDEALRLAESGLLSNSDLLVNQIGQTQDLLVSLVVPLSIPLLLFSLDIRNSLKHVKSGLLSLVIAVFSLLIAVVVGHFLFRETLPESWKISGMMVGLYTGGTPNLAALATALDVQPSIFILTHTYDLIVGIFLLLFFITIGQRTLNLFLPHFNSQKPKVKTKEIIEKSEGVDNFIDYFKWKTTKPLLGAIGLSVLIFGAGYGLSMLFPKDMLMTIIILSITTLGIGFSLIPKINKIEKTFEFGMYLILVFSLVVASMADLRIIFQIEFLSLFLYVILAVFGSLLIHVILSKIFKIDTDSTIIAITALSTSPPFVPVVAGALKNKEIIVTGITIGVIGYAVGNYLGILMAYFLKAL